MFKLNKKGQTLIMFVILIPVLIFLIASISDLAIYLSAKIKFQDIGKNALQDNLTIEEIKEVYQKNKLEIINLELKEDNNISYLVGEGEVKSLFANIVGVNNYKIKINVGEENE